MLHQIICFQQYSRFEGAIVLIITLCIIIGTIKADDNMMMSTWMFIVASKYVDFDDVMKISYYTLLVLIPVVIGLCLMGYIRDVAFHRGTFLRHSLGFSHPNTLGVRVFQLMLAHCYIRRQKLSLLDYLLVVGAICFVKYVPNCQTTVYVLSLFLIFLIVKRLFDHIPNGTAIYLRMMVLIAVLANGISVFMSVIDVKRYAFLKRIDLFASKRFSLCHNAISYYGISMFGTKIDLFEQVLGRIIRRFYIDTSYVALMIRYGVVVYVIFTAVYMITMIKAVNNKKYMLCTVLALYSVYGIMENSFFSLAQNIFLISLCWSIYPKNEMVDDTCTRSSRKRISITI